jgi:predicted metal-binding membrane protein
VQGGSELASRMSAARRETWAPLVLGGVLLGAGIYQFTPLKASCLRQCQTPMGFVMTHWREGTRGALQMGFRHGAICLGCCWALFAVLVATGVMSLAWMLLLTLVVSVEKLLPLGQRASWVIGAMLIALGAIVAIGGTTLPWTA